LVKLIYAKQVLYHFGHAFSPFVLGYFFQENSLIFSQPHFRPLLFYSVFFAVDIKGMSKHAYLV
jgi:hypothetical protein